MANDPLTKHTLFLRAGDMEYMISAMPKGKASYAVRKVIANFVDKLREQEKKLPLDAQPPKT